MSGSATLPVLPTTEEEIWRYSRIGELDLSAFTPTAAAPQVAGDTGAATVTVVAAGPETPDLFADEPAPDVFATLNRDAATTVHIVVPAGAVVADPIVVTHRVPADGAWVSPRLVVEAGRDSQVTVVERFESAAAGPALVVPVLQIDAAPAARVSYLAVNDLDDQVWSIGNQQARGDRDSSVLLATVALSLIHI